MADDASELCHEATMLAALNHPKIIRFYGLSRSLDGHLVLVMEYVPLCLETFVKRGESVSDSRPPGLGWADAHRLVLELAQTLAYIHGEHMVHLDLKPANVLLSEGEDGHLHIKLCDLGMAKMTKRGPRGYLWEKEVGTPGFMPPEAILLRRASTSEPEAVGDVADARDANAFAGKVGYSVNSVAEINDPMKWDIFGLGILAWVCWSLQEPFQHASGSDDMNHRVFSGERPCLDAGSATMPQAFRGVLERLWAQNLLDRPTAEEAVALLQEPEIENEISRQYLWETEGMEPSPDWTLKRSLDLQQSPLPS